VTSANGMAPAVLRPRDWGMSAFPSPMGETDIRCRLAIVEYAPQQRALESMTSVENLFSACWVRPAGAP
jgi:hypothetical protein